MTAGLELLSGATYPTPGAGYDAVWVRSTDKHLMYTDDAGQIYDLTALSTRERVFRPVIGALYGAFLLTSGDAYFTYLGQVHRDITPKYVAVAVTTAGVGAQTAEIGLFSTPAAPNKAGQSLTKLVSTGALGNLAATGVVRNSAAFATLIPAGTFLWAGIRVAMATTQPTLSNTANDIGGGLILQTAAAAVLTGAG